MLNDFKKFILKGNIVDMATGIIIGVAFAAIVSSLVTDIISPPIGMLFNGIDFNDLFIVLKEGATPGPYQTIELARKAGAVTMNYGIFLNKIFIFLIVALAIFILIKKVLTFQKDEEKAVEPPKPSAEESLLTEIRDLLSK